MRSASVCRGTRAAYREIDLEQEVRAVLDELGIDPAPQFFPLHTYISV